VELRRSVDPDAVHTVLFTFGTTGSPRRVELTDRNHHASATASAERLGVDTDNLAVLLRSAIYVTMAVVHESFNPARVHAVLEGGRRDGS
jgi:O-succinylbenzoic acid--CoA ligase